MKPDSIREAFEFGWQDRAVYGLLRQEQLYRRPWSRRVAWRLGWEFAHFMTKRPLRTERPHRRAPLRGPKP